jgi:hypothetical protein
MLSEIVAAKSSKDGRGAWFWNGMGGCAFTAKYPPNPLPSTPDVLALCDNSVSQIDKNMTCTEDPSSGNVFASARSKHRVGVNVAMADHSTHFVNEKIDAIVWQALSTRAGPASEPDASIDD